jgi:ADP-dependent NAD(P)H-hydrate dehydratase / NAD(P)H-hydrate epimerase
VIPVGTAAQVRELDRRVIEDLGVPGAALMEIAARGVAKAIARSHGEDARRGTVVVCGGGNNGGDGYAVARWLDQLGFPVAIWSIDDASRGDAAIMREAARRLQLPEVDGLGEAWLIVDGLFGTGLDRPVTGRKAEVIAAMNAHPAPVVAIDVPSGLHSDTGTVMGVAVEAVHTVVLGRYKAGLFAGAGPDLAGQVTLVDLGLDALATYADAAAELPEPADLAPLWPVRGAGDHKNRSGHLLVIAGSANMAGAAILTCRGAFAAGVGLVTLVAPRGAVARLERLPPEVMLLVHGDGDVLTDVPASALHGRTAIAAGPGLGGGQPLSDALVAGLRAVWAGPVPAVFDADALIAAEGPTTAPRVITPHPGEAARRLGTTAAAIEADRFAAVERLADGPTALLKGRYTLVATPGRRVSINPRNSPVLATGGSGDVLTGVIGALLARGVAAHNGARLAAYVHGRAGERLEAERSAGWTAGDVAGEVANAIAELVG